MAPLERVAWLEQENAALRAEIARLDAHAALEETVHTRPPARRSAASAAVAAIMFVVLLATVLAPLVLIAAKYQGGAP